MSTHTLVLGGTGKTGRRIVERLRAQGVSVRVGSRSLPFDWYDASTWEGALDDVAAVYVSYYPDLAVEGAPEAVGAFARLAAAARRQAAGAALRPRRARGAARRAGGDRGRHRVDDRALQLVRAELQRGVPARRRPRGRDRAAGGRRPRAVRRRRGHRRRRGRRADPGRPPRPDLRADRPAGAALRRGRGGDRRRDRARRALRPGAGRRVPRRDARGGRAGRRGRRWSRSCSARCSTGATCEPQDGVRRALGRAPRDFGEYARATAASGAWS